MSCKHGNWDCEICEEIDQAYNNGVAAGRKAEREECAKLCEEKESYETGVMVKTGTVCARQIRARGEVK